MMIHSQSETALGILQWDLSWFRDSQCHLQVVKGLVLMNYASAYVLTGASVLVLMYLQVLMLVC